MTPTEALDIARLDIEANTRHGVIPAELARSIVDDLASEFCRWGIGELEKLSNAKH